MSVYTTDHSTSVLSTHSWRTAQNSAPHLLPYIKPDMKILDVGCGPGSISIDLAKLVPTGHVTGVEYVSDPLEGARKLAQEAGVSNITFKTGDIHALPFEDSSFDIVHAHQVLQHIGDPILALREMKRVAKVGGMVVCRESASMTWYPPNEGIQLWKDLTGKMGREKGGNPHPGSMIHVWAEKGGFKLADVQRSAGTWLYSTPEEREYWGGSMEERARSSGFSRKAVEEGYATSEELEKIANGWREWVEDADGWFGMMHGEILCWKKS